MNSIMIITRHCVLSGGINRRHFILPDRGNDMNNSLLYRRLEPGPTLLRCDEQKII